MPALDKGYHAYIVKIGSEAAQNALTQTSPVLALRATDHEGTVRALRDRLGYLFVNTINTLQQRGLGPELDGSSKRLNLLGLIEAAARDTTKAWNEETCDSIVERVFVRETHNGVLERLERDRNFNEAFMDLKLHLPRGENEVDSCDTRGSQGSDGGGVHARLPSPMEVGDSAFHERIPVPPRRATERERIANDLEAIANTLRSTGGSIESDLQLGQGLMAIVAHLVTAQGPQAPSGPAPSNQTAMATGAPRIIPDNQGKPRVRFYKHGNEASKTSFPQDASIKSGFSPHAVAQPAGLPVGTTAVTSSQPTELQGEKPTKMLAICRMTKESLLKLLVGERTKLNSYKMRIQEIKHLLRQYEPSYARGRASLNVDEVRSVDAADLSRQLRRYEIAQCLQAERDELESIDWEGELAHLLSRLNQWEREFAIPLTTV